MPYHVIIDSPKPCLVAIYTSYRVVSIVNAFYAGSIVITRKNEKAAILPVTMSYDTHNALETSTSVAVYSAALTIVLINASIENIDEIISI